jgi:hypothetical protein
VPLFLFSRDKRNHCVENSSEAGSDAPAGSTFSAVHERGVTAKEAVTRNNTLGSETEKSVFGRRAERLPRGKRSAKECQSGKLEE